MCIVCVIMYESGMRTFRGAGGRKDVTGSLLSMLFCILACGGDNDFNPSVQLGLGDIAVDDHSHTWMLRVMKKQSKMDPFHKGVNPFVGRGSTSLCPVDAVLEYVAVRGMEPGPLSGQMIPDQASLCYSH